MACGGRPPRGQSALRTLCQSSKEIGAANGGGAVHRSRDSVGTEGELAGSYPAAGDLGQAARWPDATPFPQHPVGPGRLSGGHRPPACPSVTPYGPTGSGEAQRCPFDLPPITLFPNHALFCFYCGHQRLPRTWLELSAWLWPQRFSTSVAPPLQHRNWLPGLGNPLSRSALGNHFQYYTVIQFDYAPEKPVTKNFLLLGSLPYCLGTPLSGKVL